MNGDGKADIVGFANNIILAGLSMGRTVISRNYVMLSNDFVYLNDWSIYDNNPRTFGDVNGDGYLDVIGFEGRGV